MRARRLSPGARAGAAAGAALAAVYLATLAPGLTFWDAGEFVAAVETFGVPHPPGTPLYVALARVWRAALPLVPTAAATNALSAACTAAAGALAAALLARATAWPPAALAGALCAGTMSTAWLNATETEVYGASLLLSSLMLWSGERAGRTGERRDLLLTAYLMALAAPLHLTALVAAPATVLLAASGPTVRWRTAAWLSAHVVLVVGFGTAMRAPLIAAAVLLALLALAGGRVLPPHAWPAGARARAGALAALVVLALLAASAFLILLVRARHDPALNQGNPATLRALLDVVGRAQYDVPGLWPRQAPWWIQLGNVVQYADWQVALGLAPGVAPAVWRTPLTVAFLALGVAGAVEHRRRDRRSWRALLLLLASGSIGVVAYLNLKAGPSFGYGALQDTAPHEPRERDYFFVLAFWTWGLWAGLGAVRLAERLRLRQRVRVAARAAGVAVAALPLLLNWRAVDRRREPDASLPGAFARALLRSAPPDAVLLAWGDNDTYPLWYAQQVEGVRPDVTVVPLPLLPAPWYRQEIARRTGLLADGASAWRGQRAVVADLAAHAAVRARPLAVVASLPAVRRAWAGDRWRFAGLAYVRDADDVDSPGQDARRLPAGQRIVFDTTAIVAARARVSPVLLHGPPRRSTDPTARYVYGLLLCPGLALRAGVERAAADSLDSMCNFR